MTSAGAERFEIPGTGDRVIRGEVRVVPQPRGSVVLLHGFKGFARFAFFPWLADQLAANGLTAVTFNFSGSGIVTDGDTADPLLATSSVEIANNQVVGCVTTGIALAFGLTRSPTITWSCLAA